MTQTQINAAAVLRIREIAGVPQKVFARSLGISPRTLRAWEAGDTIPHLAQLVLAMADAALAGSAGTWGAALAEQLRKGAVL